MLPDITLEQWKKEFGLDAKDHPAGVTYTEFRPQTDSHRALFRLSDYYVSSIQAGTVWLGKRQHIEGR